MINTWRVAYKSATSQLNQWNSFVVDCIHEAELRVISLLELVDDLNYGKDLNGLFTCDSKSNQHIVIHWVSALNLNLEICVVSDAECNKINFAKIEPLIAKLSHF